MKIIKSSDLRGALPQLACRPRRIGAWNGDKEWIAAADGHMADD